MNADAGVRCPLSGSADVELVEEIASERLLELWQTRLGLDVGAELEGVACIRGYRSNATGLQFFLPSEAMGSGSLYEQLDRRGDYYTKCKWEHAAALDDLKGAGAVLEIGCGDGEFIARAGEALAEPVHGLELNRKAAEQAARAGLEVYTLPLASFAAAHAGEYGAVCAFQVLEHTADPLAFLRDALRLVRSPGRLIVSVPNNASFVGRETDNLLDLPPHHMTRWSADVFEHLAQLLPVRVERTAFEPLAEYHVGWYSHLATTGKWFKRSRKRALRRRLRSASARAKVRGHTLYVCLAKTGADG